MDETERNLRMTALHNRVVRNDVFHWGRAVLAALEDAVSDRGRYIDTQPKKLRPGEIRDAYLRTARRLVVLDYDGTLVPFAKRPQQAVPPQVVLDLLTALAGDPKNLVALMSGRSSENLERWFGKIPRLCLVAEHGAELKAQSASTWESLRPQASSVWKPTVMPILEHFVDRTPWQFRRRKEICSRMALSNGGAGIRRVARK